MMLKCKIALCFQAKSQAIVPSQASDGVGKPKANPNPNRQAIEPSIKLAMGFASQQSTILIKSYPNPNIYSFIDMLSK